MMDILNISLLSKRYEMKKKEVLFGYWWGCVSRGYSPEYRGVCTATTGRVGFGTAAPLYSPQGDCLRWSQDKRTKWWKLGCLAGKWLLNSWACTWPVSTPHGESATACFPSCWWTTQGPRGSLAGCRTVCMFCMMMTGSPPGRGGHDFLCACIWAPLRHSGY